MQVSLALEIGSTSLVSTNMRGKLGGLFNTAESLGRFLGPAGYSVTYAWSVSISTLQAYGGWVDYRFVFYASAVVIAVMGTLAWNTLTIENLMKPELEGVVGAGIAAGDEDVGGSLKDVTRTPSPSSCSPLDHVRRGERFGASGDEDRGSLMTRNLNWFEAHFPYFRPNHQPRW